MKPLALALLLVAATHVAGDDVVNAAKAAKAKRKQSTTKVITNADVKKAKGKIAENKLAPLPVDATPTETLTEKQAREKKESAEYATKLAAAEKAVRELEAELAAIEQTYYDENDLDRRDGELVKRFNATKAKLDKARVDLGALKPAAPQEP